MVNGTAVDDRIGVILDLNAGYPVAMDIVLLKQTLEGRKEDGRKRQKGREVGSWGGGKGEGERRMVGR